MALDRSDFVVAENPELRDDSLPTLTLSGNISTADDLDYVSVALEAGEYLYIDFRFWADPAVVPPAMVLDVYDSAGQKQSLYATSSGAFVSFRAPDAGIYFLAVHNDPNFAGTPPPQGGAYTAHLSLGPSIDPVVEGILSGAEWERLALTYSFPTAASDYEYQPPAGFMPFASEDQFGAIRILEQVATFSGLTFTQASTPGGGDLRFGGGDTGYYAYANYPGDGAGGDVWFSSNALLYSDLQRGSDFHFSLIHEIGHALGLKHGHESPPIPPEHNSHEFSVMTYFSWVGSEDSFFNGDEQSGDFPQTFMMVDIAALQHLYGANFDFNAGNSIYRWDPSTGQMSIDGVGQWVPKANRIFMTLWDGGGDDIYDLSNYANGVRVDLRPGEWTTTSSAQLANLRAEDPLPPIYARGNIANARLYQGDTRSLIENAVGGAGDDVLIGNQASNRLIGNAGNDSLDGGDGNDVLEGGVGLDLLDGGAGADVMIGGADDDVYEVDDVLDQVIESADGGSDDHVGSFLPSYTLPANVERLTLVGAAVTGIGNDQDDLIAGNEFDNILQGGAGDDTLAGRAGNDVLDGGVGADLHNGEQGNDTYIVDNVGDQVVEHYVGDGIDLVMSSIAYTLPTLVENLTLTGAAAINGTGNALANSLTGNAAANRLDGGVGADTMAGGGGDDIYVVDDSGDLVTEASSSGKDLVRSSVTHTLGANVEKLTLTGTSAINGTGNAQGNSLLGNSAANLLDGSAGADAMAGGAGNDTYMVDNLGDRVSENAGEGTDTVMSSVSFSLTSHVDNLVLTGAAAINATGNSQANSLTGNSAANLINGGGGADAMAGAGGNDIYIVDNVGDTVTELAAAGTDLVKSSVTFTLGANVERLTLRGGAAINGTGNELANTIAGNEAANRLDGGAGADKLLGAGGNDTYVVDNIADQVIESSSGGGIDSVESSVSFSLGDHVEDLTLTGSAAVDGTGNDIANVLTGNGAANVLDGGRGNDTLSAGGGDDRLVGGLGSDSLFGGIGADDFSFDKPLGATNVDTILDFAAGSDDILLENAVFKGLAAGALSANALAIGAAAADADDRIVYDPTTGNLYFDADGTGAAAQILFATLDNAPPTLAASDFAVI